MEIIPRYMSRKLNPESMELYHCNYLHVMLLGTQGETEKLGEENKVMWEVMSAHGDTDLFKAKYYHCITFVELLPTVGYNIFYQFCQTIVLHAISFSQRVNKIFMKCINAFSMIFHLLWWKEGSK